PLQSSSRLPVDSPTQRRKVPVRRFQTAMLWGKIVTKDLLGGPISAAKLNQPTASAVTACDAADGVTDGIIDDPRTCHFSATANICGGPDRARDELPDSSRGAGD